MFLTLMSLPSKNSGSARRRFRYISEILRSSFFTGTFSGKLCDTRGMIGMKPALSNRARIDIWHHFSESYLSKDKWYLSTKNYAMELVGAVGFIIPRTNLQPSVSRIWKRTVGVTVRASARLPLLGDLVIAGGWSRVWWSPLQFFYLSRLRNFGEKWECLRKFRQYFWRATTVLRSGTDILRNLTHSRSGWSLRQILQSGVFAIKRTTNLRSSRGEALSRWLGHIIFGTGKI